MVLDLAWWKGEDRGCQFLTMILTPELWSEPVALIIFETSGGVLMLVDHPYPAHHHPVAAMIAPLRCCPPMLPSFGASP